jgi:vancomycin resistance protein VanW
VRSLADVGSLELRARRAVLAARQARRLASWAFAPGKWRAPELAGEAPFPHRVYEASIPIARADAAAHPILERGKRANVALAAPRFDGVVVSPNAPLSFWRALGRVTAARGFVWGMELRSGCVVPALGGGICLLSNALFEMAARLGWTILERHGHSLDAGQIADLDATVLWPHIDLRVAPASGRARLGMRVVRDAVVLEVFADAPRARQVRLHVIEGRAEAPYRARTVMRTVDGASEIIARDRKRALDASERTRNCLTCDETDCHARVAVGAK